MTIGEKISFRGKYFSAEVDALPKIKTYFLIGGTHPAIIRQAAKVASEWNIYACPVEEYLKCKKILSSASSGRDIAVSQTGVVLIAESRQDLLKCVKRRLTKLGRSSNPEVEIQTLKKQGTICGTPGEVISQINERKNLGIDRFYLEVADMTTRDMADLLTETLRGV
jgi:alkanesulfonate monooxygenase SsuD/methylene tetrahydromethanopterin reductase-like flavin-dependent oxidoreductase (luciferase family)